MNYKLGAPCVCYKNLVRKLDLNTIPFSAIELWVWSMVWTGLHRPGLTLSSGLTSFCLSLRAPAQSTDQFLSLSGHLLSLLTSFCSLSPPFPPLSLSLPSSLSLSLLSWPSIRLSYPDWVKVSTVAPIIAIQAVKLAGLEVLSYVLSGSKACSSSARYYLETLSNLWELLVV